MRRDRRPLTPTGFRASDWLRLMSMVTMLCLLVLLMVRMRDPSMWKWVDADDADEDAPVAAVERPGKATAELPGEKSESPAKKAEAPAEEVESPAEKVKSPAGNATALAEPAEAPSAPPVPAPIEIGTDLEQEESDGFVEEIQAIDDRGLFIRREEMEAYNRLVRWSVAQPFDSMYSRGRGDLKFNDLIQAPEKHRGKLIRMKLNAWRVLKCDEKTRDGHELHELWASTDQSGVWLHDIIVVNLPEDMPTGSRINEQVRFVGYFLKLQGYYPAVVTPNARPLYAPLLIGRIERVPPPTPEFQETDTFWFSLVAGGFALLFVVPLGWQFFRRNRRKSGQSLLEVRASRTSPGLVEAWFETASAGDDDSGNNSSTPDDSSVSHPDRNDNGDTEANLLRDR